MFTPQRMLVVQVPLWYLRTTHTLSCNCFFYIFGLLRLHLDDMAVRESKMLDLETCDCRRCLRFLVRFGEADGTVHGAVTIWPLQHIGDHARAGGTSTAATGAVLQVKSTAVYRYLYHKRRTKKRMHAQHTHGSSRSGERCHTAHTRNLLRTHSAAARRAI